MRDIYCIILYIFPDIREDIGSRSRRTTFTEEVQRKHFITRRDLLNMKRKVCHLTATRHEDDAISVDYLIQELRQEEYDPVLLYKPQHQVISTLPHC